MIEAGTKNGEMRRAPRAVYSGVGVFDHRQTANARTNHHTRAASLFFIQRVACRQPGILDGLGCGGNAVMDETVHRPRLFGGNVGLEIKVLDFTHDPAGHG